MTTAIRHRVGTYRALDPQDTWSRIDSGLPRFGITRVADITDLDDIGIPTFVAYRPDSKTVAVSIGTGLNAMQARVSAAMESIEGWHAENPVLKPEFRATAEALELPYDVRALNLAARSPLTGRCLLDWTTGTGLLSGQVIPVPLDTIQIDYTRRRSWAYALFGPTTNGVATGNTPAEAALHGLLEVVERECIAGYIATGTAELRYLDVEEAASDYICRIVSRLRSAGCLIVVADITNRLGIPCYAARIWSPDVPIRTGGFGCHVDAEIAVGRALLEAAQSRLAAISGARDDINADAYQAARPIPEIAALGDVTIVPLRSRCDSGAPDLESVVRYCAGRIAEVTGFEPFTVDLAHDDIGIPARKAYAPGVLMFDPEKLNSPPAHRT